MISYIHPDSKLELYMKDSTALVDNLGNSIDIVDGIPRFVSSDNYAQAFGLEWTIHRKTQLDSSTGTNISMERLERCIGHSLESLSGLDVFEPGCGAGRFTELMVNAGANVHSIDLSVAVDANRKSIGEDRRNYQIAQASITNPPYRANSFDYVVSLGVIQHTPSSEQTMRVLYDMIKPGGKLVIDHYTYSLSHLTKLAPLYRFFLKRINAAKAKKITDRLTDFFFPIHWTVRKYRILQMLLSRFSPCLFYYRSYPGLSKQEHYDWTKLDTYDHLTDFYKHLRTKGQILIF
jgi:SAM-dependent methyltransferase